MGNDWGFCAERAAGKFDGFTCDTIFGELILLGRICDRAGRGQVCRFPLFAPVVPLRFDSGGEGGVKASSLEKMTKDWPWRGANCQQALTNWRRSGVALSHH